MSLEEDLTRQLHAKAAALRPTPDLDDLSRRIYAGELRARQHERMALAAAVIVLVASLGGLVGVIVSAPVARQTDALQSRYTPGAVLKTPAPRDVSPRNGPAESPLTQSPRVVINRQLASGLDIMATLQNLPAPVAITNAWSAASTCATGEILTTTVGEGGSFGGGVSVAQLPALGPLGLAVLSSGALQVAGGAQEWWVTVAVGSGVSRVAAENVGGSPVTVVPSAGAAVIAGQMSGPDAGTGEMSAVAEGEAGDTSLGFLLGSGPKAVGESPAVGDASGCSIVSLPTEPSSASSSQPADPGLAAGSIVAAFEQADSPNPLLGFAANLAAVSGGDRLGLGALAPRQVERKGGAAIYRASGVAPAAPVVIAAGKAGTLEVRQVYFLSASLADVVYSSPDGVLVTGSAQLGSSGSWLVSLGTFCSNLGSGIVAGVVPAEVLRACQTQR